MKYKFIFLLSFCIFSFSTFAQDNQQDNHEKRDQKMKALYIAYMTEQLNLNENEAQRFWPLHKEYNAELKAIRKERQSELATEEASLNVKKKYNDKFLKILGKERTEDFYKKDKEFRDKVIKKIREKRNEQMGQHKDPKPHKQD